MKYVVLVVIALTLYGCESAKQEFISQDRFCKISFSAFQNNDLKKYLTLTRTQADVEKLIAKVKEFKPQSKKDKYQHERALKNLDKIKRFQKSIVKEAFEYARKKFPVVISDGKKAGVVWQDVKMVTCEFKSMGRNPIMSGWFVYMKITHQGKIYKIEQEVWETARGFLLKDYPKWRGEAK